MLNCGPSGKEQTGSRGRYEAMVYQGHVEDGTIRLQDSVVLPEGTEVRDVFADTSTGR